MAATPLNIFQRGIFQTTAFLFAYICSTVIGAFVLDLTEKQIFITTVQQALQQGIITPEGFSGLKSLIESRAPLTIFAVITIGMFCIFLGWSFMRWSAKRNWSWPVTLHKAVEFRWAMEQLGIVDPGDRMDFVRKHKLRVFIAMSPLVGNEQESVRAQYYAFVHDQALRDTASLAQHIGRQTLCLDMADYESLFKAHKQKADATCSARIAVLEQDNAALAGAASLYVAELAKLAEENKKLQEENAAFQRKQQTAPSRESKMETSNIRRVPFWRVAGPLINRMIEEARPGAEYCSPEIQAIFDAEVHKFPELQEAIKQELHRYKHNPPRSEFDLDGWAMDSIREGLGGLVQKEPKRPKKVKKC